MRIVTQHEILFLLHELMLHIDNHHAHSDISDWLEHNRLGVLAAITADSMTSILQTLARHRGLQQPLIAWQVFLFQQKSPSNPFAYHLDTSKLIPTMKPSLLSLALRCSSVL